MKTWDRFVTALVLLVVTGCATKNDISLLQREHQTMIAGFARSETLLLDRIGNLDGELQRIKEDAKLMSENLTGLKFRQDELKQRADETYSALGSLQQRTISVEKQLDGLAASAENSKRSIETLLGNVKRTEDRISKLTAPAIDLAVLKKTIDESLKASVDERLDVLIQEIQSRRPPQDRPTTRLQSPFKLDVKESRSVISVGESFEIEVLLLNAEREKGTGYFLIEREG